MTMEQQSIESQWYVAEKDGSVQCTLCPHSCMLKEGKVGLCRVRKNKHGKLVSDVYGFVSALNFDPIEKKPLYHYYPGSNILSIGTYGCNLRCFFCQNCTISQTGPEPGLPRNYHTPEEIVDIALKKPGNMGIAFTYNEPLVWYEYLIEIARLAKAAGLKTVMVTNGFINPEPLAELIGVIDAFSVDLKAFSEEFYAKVTWSQLEPVKRALQQIAKAGKHLEIVNLVVPGLNDDESIFTEMVKWIAKELGKDTVLHLSRYFPNYKSEIEATPIFSIIRMKRIADRELHYVYTGNMFDENNETRCLKCKNLLITRQSYVTYMDGLDEEGRCKACGEVFQKKS